MIKKTLAPATLFAAHVAAMGSAIVVNDCSHDSYIQNTPGGGGAPIAKTLSPGATYSQTWTGLGSGGWSIKIAPNSDSDWMNDILQYEYTLDGSTIWFDISEVNGSPFGGKQHISSTDGCKVKQTAYRYPTDDTYGMQQSCSSEATVQVNLCSGKGGSGKPHAHKPGHKHHPHHPKPAPPPPDTSTYVAPTSVAPVESAAPTTTAKKHWNNGHHKWGGPPAAAAKVEDVEGKKKLGNGMIGHKSPQAPDTTAPPSGAATTVTNMVYTTLHKYVTKYE